MSELADKLPGFPERPEFAFGRPLSFEVLARYQDALVAAWEARCRLAIDALVELRVDLRESSPESSSEIREASIVAAYERAGNALLAIGHFPRPEVIEPTHE